MKKLFLLLLVALLAGGGWFAWNRKPQAQASAAPSATDKPVARAERRDIAFSIEISGDITPDTPLDVKPEVGGKIKALHVELGQVVKQGELLVEIDDRDLLTEKESALTDIDGAQLSVERSRKNFDRGKGLFEAKLISQEVFDNLSSEFAIAENGFARAQRKLQLVEDKLRKTKVLAAQNGTVLTLPVVEGQVAIAAASVNSGTTLMTIADLSKLLVETHINQVDVAKIELNQVVKLRAESFKDVEMEARISRIAPTATVKNNVKGFQVLAAIEDPNPRIRPGMTVNMTVPIASAEDAVSVPIAAVFKGEGNKKVVYVRNGDIAERREVKVGVSDISHAQILKGVDEGEEILLVEPPRAPGEMTPHGAGGGRRQRS